MWSLRIRKCNNCGSIVVLPSGQRECGPCATRRLDVLDRVEQVIAEQGCDDAATIARETGLPEKEVTRVIRESPWLKSLVRTDTPCKMCRRRPVKTGSDYCPECRSLLNDAFGRAAETTLSRAEERMNRLRATGGRMLVRQSLQEKRGTTGGSKNFTPKGRWSG
jgi:hypothetical protein